MYLYNIDHYLRNIRREEIKNILLELDASFVDIANKFGTDGLTITPFPEQKAIMVTERQQYVDRSFDNPNKDVTSGLILYYTLIGTDICMYNAFRCDTNDFKPGIYFGKVTPLGVEKDSHFKKIKTFTEKIRMLYPKMLTNGSDVYYKNTYLLLNSYPATAKQRFDVSQALKEVSGCKDIKYHKAYPTVSFSYQNENMEVLVRQDCILYRGIVYPDVSLFIQAMQSGFPYKIEDILTDTKPNKNFITFVKNPRMELSDFIFMEQNREMDENSAKTGELLF